MNDQPKSMIIGGIIIIMQRFSGVKSRTRTEQYRAGACMDYTMQKILAVIQEG